MEILVTGGGGFLGQAIVRQLLDRGDRVRVLNRNDYPELSALGVACHIGHIGDLEAVMEASNGVDAVIHVAAKAGAGLCLKDFWETNVTGCEHVIEACRHHGIERLVYTSSPSVVHAGQDIENGDESLAYASHFQAPYPMTKAEGEKRILAANGAGLKTCAIRPHLIWGPGDNQLLPRLIEKNRARGIRLPAPEKKIDTVYIDNAALAHLLALDALTGEAPAQGLAFFISNGEPQGIGEMMKQLLEAAGEVPNIKPIPLPLARLVATLVEGFWRLTRRDDEPPLSRFVIEHLSTSHWYNLDRARKVLGYRPVVSLAQGLERLQDQSVSRPF